MPERSERYEIIYTVCEDDGSEYDVTEIFEGTWDEMREEIKAMKQQGYYNISVACVSSGEDY